MSLTEFYNVKRRLRRDYSTIDVLVFIITPHRIDYSIVDVVAFIITPHSGDYFRVARSSFLLQLIA
jgi:hypothetical protein